ncbi:MAG TPA: hypothetical protein VMU43_07855 [Candidatus Acidoferrum sp.]|nr:hypothetical protein [Candidatus Acidoferrum sp.]
MMRPGRATLDEQEPCPACLPKRAARQRQQKGTESKETVPSLAPGGAKSLSSTVARTSPKRASRKKRIRLADAFRSRGIDEYVIADGYAVALKTLKPKEGGATEASIGKTFMDTLKECSRILDPPRTSTERGASDAPAVVQLIHRVPRPARGRDGLPQG